MEAVWFKSDLADEIMKNNDIFDQTHNIVADIVTSKLEITCLVENMGAVLTNKEAENREQGMRFFTKILKEIPSDYLTEIQIKYISKFYIDRLKDNHRVIPAVLEGYLYIVDMNNYNIQNSGEYFTVLFREVACQSQVRHDRYNIYLTIQKVLEKDVNYMKTLGPDFIYGVISSMDGERDPRNLLFLFNLLPKFLSQIPLGHLVEEMFEVISCYYPIDFHPSPNDPAAVSRDDLANALCPCLCAVPEFAEHCLILLIEKLDSSLRIAKLDSLFLLATSCKTFKAESYGPFIKALWSSIHREITHKTDEELKLAAHEALSALASKLATIANTDQTFENFIKGILISLQTAIAESTTVIQFVQAAKILLTVTNSSKESCEVITKSMIPAVLAYYEFKTSPKLQIASLDFLADLYEMAKHWSVISEIEQQVSEIPQLCLTAVSERSKEHQIGGFKTLIRVIDALKIDFVVPFVEILIYNIQNSQDDELLRVSIECVHAMARKYPELIMGLVVKGKCDISNLSQDKTALQKRLNLLSSLASIDDFTQIIIEEMLKFIQTDEDSVKIVTALNNSISNTSLYSNDKIAQIETDHGLIESILNWLYKEIEASHDSLDHGFTLISNTMCSLNIVAQQNILNNKTKEVLVKCTENELYLQVVESLYRSLHQSAYNVYFEEILSLALKLSLKSDKEIVRLKACCLIAHFLNKAENGQKFELMYEILKNYLSSIGQNEDNLCPRLLNLYGWIAKALLLRGSDLFQFWLNKILLSISNPESSTPGSEAIHTIMKEYPDYLNARSHCKTSLLYKQRMFHTFTKLSEKLDISNDTKEAYCLSWAYVLEKTPKTVLNSEVNKIAPLVVDALEYDNKDLLLVMLEVLIHFVQAKNVTIAQSLQSILPRLINLTTYVKSMEYPDYLNARSHCKTSLLYKQRMFHTFTKLSEKLDISNDTKEAYCLSWAYVLEKTPKTVLNSEVNKIAPLVVDALEYDNKDLLLVMLEVLIHFVQAKNVTIAQSAQSILPRLINLTTYVKSMDVRIKSLQCLYEIASSYSTVLLIPYKQDILIDLAPSLDDKKRLVRNMAVKARTRWFLVGSPERVRRNKIINKL